MKPDPIDDFLAKAAAPPPDAATVRAGVERAQSAVLGDLRPVRPLGSPVRSALLFLAAFAAIAVLAGLILGPHGFHVLSALQRVLIFSALCVAAAVAALACTRAMRPASGASLSFPSLLLAAVGFPVLFAFLFAGYNTLHFVHEGIPCLVAGLCVSIPTCLLLLPLLRRGFVLDRRQAALACGTLAGLAGLAMLEIHCPNLRAIHVMVWHVAVVLVSAVLAWAIARLAW
ncbi:MAG TPA: NrsF family protein [Acidobacteriaceae bacterium]|nr:NrsF family protein [Acidobacteriaceae bacterium]